MSHNFLPRKKMTVTGKDLAFIKRIIFADTSSGMYRTFRLAIVVSLTFVEITL
jgi:hypothetical protein